MSLPPEHIRIKRRRDDDPIETLYIQSSDARTAKRRFTDFVFQRVQHAGTSEIGGNGGLIDNTARAASAGAAMTAAAARAARAQASELETARQARATAGETRGRSPRTVPYAGSSQGVPRIKATAPGEELRARNQGQGQGQASPAVPSRTSTPLSSLSRPGAGNASPSSPSPSPSSSVLRHARATKDASTSSPSRLSAAHHLSLLNLRKFHLATPLRDRAIDTYSRATTPGGNHTHTSTSTSGFDLQQRASSSASKRRRTGGGAVLVEKLVQPEREREREREPSLSAAEVDELVARVQGVDVSGRASPSPSPAGPGSGVSGRGTSPAPAPTIPRKRPVVNDASRRWRAEQAGSSSKFTQRLEEMERGSTAAAAGKGGKAGDDAGTWDRGSDELADELGRIAREMTGVAGVEEEYLPQAVPVARDEEEGVGLEVPAEKPRLKYQPRVQPRPRRTQETAKTTKGVSSATESGAGMETEAEAESDGEYIYDVFIRRPAHEIEEELRRLGGQPNEQATAPGPSAAQVLRPQPTQPHPQPQPPRNIGVVVITDEDAPFWDALAESDDDGDGKGWDSEDEDSNAEDHPANEYPEEGEVDDEFEGAWGYRSDGDDGDDDEDEEDDGGMGYRFREFSDDDGEEYY